VTVYHVLLTIRAGETFHSMTTTVDNQDVSNANPLKKVSMGKWIGVGLVLGLFCGIFFGEYCSSLRFVGEAYVGLLQMTVLPYLVLSLIAKTGRLDAKQARRLGLTALVVLLVLWLIAIVLIVFASTILPPIQGASFYSPVQELADGPDFLSTFIPTNIFRSLSNEYVPAIVVFCLFFGFALMLIPEKDPLLNFLDLCSEGIGRINSLLVRLAPFGLFTLTAAAAGTMRLEELSRLQAYLIIFTLACTLAAFAALPLLLTSLTDLSYREVLGAAQEPMLTAVATGKLFVVLPQIADKCEELIRRGEELDSDVESTSSVIVPLAYPFPHVGKILAFLFISFAAWYTGQQLSPAETFSVGVTGAMSSFASPLVTIPYLLDQHQLPQDLMALFILPGFLTMRLADVVGVMHLMVLTLIVSRAMHRRLQIRWRRLLLSVAIVTICFTLGGVAGRIYLASTSVAYDLDQRFLSLEIPEPYEEVVVYRNRDEVPSRARSKGSTLGRVTDEKVLRVGYHADRLPYSFFNKQDHLVGLDIELMHRLANRLQIRLEFIPYNTNTIIDQLASGEIDVAVGGLMVTPERLMHVGFTQWYQTATISVVLPDHRRGEFDTWDDPQMPNTPRLGATYDDVAIAGRRRLPHIDFEVVESIRGFFDGGYPEFDGLVMAAEQASAWNILYPEFTVVVPQPRIQLPVGMAVRMSETDWVVFLDRWLEFSRVDGSLDRLVTYWVRGGGTEKQPPRWSIVQNVLGWLP
jgi:Na+/H+-dicarboxylate symporter/ABC-type amino acid transport substrate-binding protein